MSVQFVPHVFAIHYSGTTGGGSTTTSTATAAAVNGHVCGAAPNAVTTSIDIGCTGTGNPILDATYAVIRFLSAGVGLVIVGSIVLAGIQYSTSRGDPQSTAKALGRIRSTLFALLIFIFGYAFLNYIIPGGFFHP